MGLVNYTPDQLDELDDRAVDQPPYVAGVLRALIADIRELRETTQRIVPGSVLRHRRTGKEVIVLGRKGGNDAIPLPGWWLTDGSGLADFIIAREWQVDPQQTNNPTKEQRQ